MWRGGASALFVQRELTLWRSLRWPPSDDADLGGAWFLGFDIEDDDVFERRYFNDLIQRRRTLPGGPFVDIATHAPVGLADKNMPLAFFVHRRTLALPVTLDQRFGPAVNADEVSMADAWMVHAFT